MMSELVPLWMAWVLGVVAAIIVECCLYCWNYTAIQYYKDLAADRMAEIADVRQANIELRHKVDELIDSNRDSLDKLDAYREQDGRMSASINDMLETIARYRRELQEANAKIDELNERYDHYKASVFDAMELIQKDNRSLKAQVEMHRTNAATAQDELHQFKIVVTDFVSEWKDCLGWAKEDLANVYEFVKGFKDEHGLNYASLAPVDSGLAGAGPVDGNAEPGPNRNAEPPQISS